MCFHLLQTPVMQFLATQPLWIAAVVLLIPTTIFAMCGPVIVRRYVPLERLRENNKVAGFKFATIGMIYAVVLAFATFVVWQRCNQADRDVAIEAGAAETVFRLTQELEAEHGAAVRKATTNYLKEAVAKDWPAMSRETSSPDVTIALNEIYSAVTKYHTPDQFEALVVSEILRDADRLSEMRRKRLVVADGIVPGIVWNVLVAGAFITMGFAFFFGSINLRAQIVMSGALAVLIFGGLLTVVGLDHPFSGNVKVAPNALIGVIEDFGDKTPR
jgi:hypothetical protein